MKHRRDSGVPADGEDGAAAVAPSDTFSRIRANCTGASYMDLDKHAAKITEVVAVARLRPLREYLCGDGDETAQAPEHPQRS